MSKSLNKAQIIGRLGGDPEVRYTASGKAVANFTVATSETWTKDGEKHEDTEWHRCVVWDKLAEICQQYLHKGDLAYFEGQIRTRKWQDQNGNDRYNTEIKVSDMLMLGSKGDRGSGAPTAPTKPQSKPAPVDESGFDDIPF